VTDDVASRVLSLPMHPELTREETDRIADALRVAVREQ
jgi:dTDP-4-amino-4,6-dideoxygalactose transaminase